MPDRGRRVRAVALRSARQRTGRTCPSGKDQQSRHVKRREGSEADREREEQPETAQDEHQQLYDGEGGRVPELEDVSASAHRVGHARTNPLRPRPCVLPPRAPTSARPRRRAAWLAGHRANSSSSARRGGERGRHRRSHRRRRGGWRGDGRRGFTRTAAVQEGHGVGTGRDGDDEEECQRRGPPPLGRSVGLTLVGLLWHPITCPGPSVHGVTRARAGSLRLQPGHAHPTTARL